MKKDKIFVITFLIIIYSVLAFYGLKQILITLDIIDLNITDNWKVYEPLKENNIIDKFENKFNSLKVSVENRADNYFPFYVKLNELYQGFNFETNKLFYNEIPLKTNSDNEYLFYDKENKFYYYETNLKDYELEKKLNKQVDFFNNLSNKGIDVYIYLPIRYELTTLKDNNLSSYISEFEEKLNPEIKVEKMKIGSIQEYKDRFYLTDHHWNIVGALDGYNSIMDMLGVAKLSNLSVKQVSNQKYYGSLAKTSMNAEIHDYIRDVDVNLDYDVLVNGKEKDKLFKPRVLAKGKTNKYYDYYVQYFNGQYGNIVYDYHQNDKENLLIMSDSYAWQIDYLIAASFNKTHVVNLRYIPYKNKEFDLTHYIKENNIEKVLFLYEGGATLFDQYDYNFSGRVK